MLSTFPWWSYPTIGTKDNGPLSLSLPSRLNQNPLTFKAQLLIYLPPLLTLKNYPLREKTVLIKTTIISLYSDKQVKFYNRYGKNLLRGTSWAFQYLCMKSYYGLLGFCLFVKDLYFLLIKLKSSRSFCVPIGQSLFMALPNGVFESYISNGCRRSMSLFETILITNLYTRQAAYHWGAFT